MRSFFLVALGAVLGVIATVMFISLDATFDPDDPEPPGGGNARLALDEEALAALIEDHLAPIAVGQDPIVSTNIEESGIVAVHIVVGPLDQRARGSLLFNPDVVEGELEIVLVESDLRGIVQPVVLIDLVETQLREQLDALANGSPYRLTAITTTARRLSLEIQI